MSIFQNHWLIRNSDPLFPPLLKEIHDPPAQLFGLGQPLDPKDRYFAVVGTRHPTPYGMQMAEAFATSLAQAGFVIVSGLAYGIDAAAHQAALDAGGKTVAVLGSGLNHIVPRCNMRLADAIEKNGAILTEYPKDEPPRKGYFPRRNRIIAGMSLATLVIEAPEKSGALITARLARQYNRDVFALPGNITQSTSRGANRFIRDGNAFPVTCLDDIFEYLGMAHSQGRLPAETPSLSVEEEQIYALLKKASCPIEQLMASARLPLPRINAVLSGLEIKGLITVIGAYAFATR